MVKKHIAITSLIWSYIFCRLFYIVSEIKSVWGKVVWQTLPRNINKPVFGRLVGWPATTGLVSNRKRCMWGSNPYPSPRAWSPSSTLIYLFFRV